MAGFWRTICKWFVAFGAWEWLVFTMPEVDMSFKLELFAELLHENCASNALGIIVFLFMFPQALPTHKGHKRACELTFMAFKFQVVLKFALFPECLCTFHAFILSQGWMLYHMSFLIEFKCSFNIKVIACKLSFRLLSILLKTEMHLSFILRMIDRFHDVKYAEKLSFASLDYLM